MKIFQNISIKIKLILIFLTISGLTLLITSGLFIYNDLEIFRKIMVRNLSVLAGSIGNSSIGSLTFNDPDSAKKILSSLKKEYQIQFAMLYDDKGNILATYKMNDNIRIHGPIMKGEGHLFLHGHKHKGDLEIVQNISYKGLVIGKISLHANMLELKAQVKKYISLAGFLFFITLVVAFLISLYFQKIISNPVLSLAEKAMDISEKGDYSMKVHYNGGDELGTLYASFNEMLEQINNREKKLKDASKRLGQFSKMLVEAQEKERKRIASELHDGLGQNLITIRNGIKQYLLSIKEKRTPGNDDLNQIASLVMETLEDVRKISGNLHPHLLDQLGLKTAIESIIKKTGQFSKINIASDIQEIEGKLSKEMEINVYRIIQEGLTNMVKHSEATKGAVSLANKGKNITISITDNGKGFDVKKATPPRSIGFGLKNIEERAKILGGTFSLESAPGGGIRIKVVI